MTSAHGFLAAAAGATAVGLASPGTTSPVQTSAGPCNMVTVNVNAQDLSHGIVEGLSVQGKLGSFRVKDIKVYLAVNVRTGKLTCTTTSSSSQVGQTNTLRAPTATEKPLRQDCSSTRACNAQGLVRLQAGHDARERITVQTGGH